LRRAARKDPNIRLIDDIDTLMFNGCTFPTLGEAFQGYLNQIGVNVDLSVVPDQA